MLSYHRHRDGVRLAHVPTGLVAVCTSERSRHRCEVGARRLLRAKLAAWRERGGPHPSAGEVVRKYDAVAGQATDMRTLWRGPWCPPDEVAARCLDRMLAIYVRQSAG
jgi:hypothetical protein